MRVSLTREKLNSLFDMVQYLLAEFPAGDKAEELVDGLIHKIRIKMRNRLDTYNIKNSYSFTLTKEEALAFELWMSQLKPMIPITNYVFEQNIALQITNKIDQIYGTIGIRKVTGAIAQGD